MISSLFGVEHCRGCNNKCIQKASQVFKGKQAKVQALTIQYLWSEWGL
jgi:hypothetical protein